ncbi:MAG: hypothetical protein ACO1NX_06955 [Chitinophagaceae bacterium]
MQDKDQYNEKAKREEDNASTDATNENAVTDDVVYVVNDDGTEFDASERTYVAVEGLEEELERREEEKQEAREEE